MSIVAAFGVVVEHSLRLFHASQARSSYLLTELDRFGWFQNLTLASDAYRGEQLYQEYRARIRLELYLHTHVVIFSILASKIRLATSY